MRGPGSARAGGHHHRGLLGELRLLPDETAGFARAGNLGMRSASAVAVLTAESDDLVHRINSGRAFEHCALQALRRGFAVSMHAGITEVEGPNLALRARLRTHSRPMVVFRLGKVRRQVDGQRSHSARPPLAEVIRPPDASFE